MNNFAKILTTIRRPFRQELRKGCKDDVVVNGLGSYVQLWAKNGDAFTQEATEKEVLNGLASLFENYASASSTERRRTLEEATKRIDAALGQEQRNPANTDATTIEPAQTRQQPTTQRPRPKKNTQTEMLPLFGETETRPETGRTKREPIAAPLTPQKQTEPPSLFGNVDTISQQTEDPPAEEATASVPISNISVSTDLASLDFLSESPQYIKGIGPRRAGDACGRTRHPNGWRIVGILPSRLY